MEYESNLPNKLTILRMILAVVFVFFVHLSGLWPKIVTLIIFSLAALTDLLDGRIAKNRNQVTDFGRFMDPLADKVLIFSAFLSFLWMQLIAVWMVMVIIARELLITGLRIFALSKGKVLAASAGGKHKTVSQMSAIFIILISLLFKQVIKHSVFWNNLFDHVIYLSMFATVILTLISGVSYLIDNRKLFYHA